MTVGKGKRPTDPNQLAKWVVDRSTDDTPKPEQEPTARPALDSASAGIDDAKPLAVIH